MTLMILLHSCGIQSMV
ncbi:hypothetical protein M0802_014475, partial [Mischocyttarus mexicanus]